MADKKSFVLYCDWLETIETLKSEGLISSEDVAIIFQAITAYQLRGDNDLSKYPIHLKIVLMPLFKTFDRDNAKYAEVCSKNRANGATGGRPPRSNASGNGTEQNRNKPNGYKETQNNPAVTNETERNQNKPNGYKETQNNPAVTNETERNRTNPKNPDNDNDLDNESDNDIYTHSDFKNSESENQANPNPPKPQNGELENIPPPPKIQNPTDPFVLEEKLQEFLKAYDYQNLQNPLPIGKTRMAFSEVMRSNEISFDDLMAKARVYRKCLESVEFQRRPDNWLNEDDWLLNWQPKKVPIVRGQIPEGQPIDSSRAESQIFKAPEISEEERLRQAEATKEARMKIARGITRVADKSPSENISANEQDWYKEAQEAKETRLKIAKAVAHVSQKESVPA